MKFSTVLTIALTAAVASAAGPLEIFITNYQTVDVVEVVTQTSTQLVIETQYVSA
jgi:hypothetical protein